LDIYVTNFIDPDFTGFPTDKFPGNRRQLYKNMLSETGEFKFVEVADDDLAGVHKDGGLESYSYDPKFRDNPNAKEAKQNNATMYRNGKLVGEVADHSW